MSQDGRASVIDCHDHVELIITTSPVPSMPSTQLISELLMSLPGCLRDCNTIITFDGFKLRPTSDQKTYAKRGQVLHKLAEQYPSYITNVKGLFHDQLCPVARIGWGEEKVSMTQEQNRTVTFIEHTRHLGFALSVKAALKYVSKRFVMVLQHDWVFENEIPGPTLLRVMMNEESINYITFMSRRSKNYGHTKGQSHHRFRAVNEATKAIRKDKPLSSSLVSCFQFLDRPHLMKVAKYRDLFDGRSELTREPFKFRRGDFTEDTLGNKYCYSIKSAQSDELALEAWKKIGAWVFVLADGERVVKHASGRTILARDEQKARIASYIERNLSRVAAQSES